MNKEVLTLVDVLAQEKNVNIEIVFQSLEEALVSATKRLHKEDVDVRVEIDRQTGEFTTYRRWMVVPSEQGLNAPDSEILLFEAQEEIEDIEIGDYIEEIVPSVDFGRIGAHAAKHVILQRLREAEREQILNEFLENEGPILIGFVRRVTRKVIVVESGRVEGFLLREKMIPRENIRVGDRIKAYIESVNPQAKGSQLELSRTAGQFLVKLFENEVPEIERGLIEIMGAARDAGVRAKVAVRTLDRHTDPIGSLIGVRGSRVGAVRNQICNEAIDIILWDEEPAQYVMNALAPAQVKSILIDEDLHAMDVVVEDSELAIAIGRSGQNVRLASELTGWIINVLGLTEAQEKQAVEVQQIKQNLIDALHIDEAIIEQLIEAQITSLEEVAYVPVEELEKIGLDEQTIANIRENARDALLMQALAKEERIDNTSISLRDLVQSITGSDTLIQQLADNHIHTLEDLAELATDELQILSLLDEEIAQNLIMQARNQCWFN